MPPQQIECVTNQDFDLLNILERAVENIWRVKEAVYIKTKLNFQLGKNKNVKIEQSNVLVTVELVDYNGRVMSFKGGNSRHSQR